MRQKRTHWCVLQFAVRCSRDLWIQIRGDVREFYSRYCLSLTPSVCVITASAPAVSSSTLSTSLSPSLSHAHTHTHMHTHALLPQHYQRRPGAGVCPCQKVTGVPIGNPKIKGPLFLLYIMIPSLCLALCKILISGFHWDYHNKHSVELNFNHFNNSLWPYSHTFLFLFSLSGVWQMCSLQSFNIGFLPDLIADT